MKAREIAYMPLVTLAPMASEIYHRDLTNRVNFGEVCDADPLEPSLRTMLAWAIQELAEAQTALQAAPPPPPDPLSRVGFLGGHLVKDS